MRKNVNDEDDLKEEDILEEVHFEIDKGAFKGPFTCCGKKTRRSVKHTQINGINFTHVVWQCGKCRKEYLDSQQPGRLERIWTLQMLLEGKCLKIERALNYDGKAYFVRFPKDLTGAWAKKKKAIITMLTPEKFLVEIAQ